ncbi:MAG: glucokinase, partial [Halioglobus sp.]
FVANAYALPHLPATDLLALRPGESKEHTRLAAMGPGTGLGGCTLDRSGETPVAAHCEPGHMGLAPDNDLEVELFRILHGRHTEVYAEYLLSGPGLVRLYEGMASLEGIAADDLSPAEITRRAEQGTDPTCVHSLQTFCALLGSVCGDFVLCNGAFGGMYLAGGIVPQITGFIAASDFEARFNRKGQMQTYLEAVPLHIITGGRTGLIGAGYAPLA